MSDRHTSGKVKLGIIGLGAQGSMYAKFIKDGMVPNMEIGVIADIHPEKREQLSSEYGVPVYPDYQSLLASGDVDAVVTTVPHYLHPEIGIAALKAGIHALVEKPAGVYIRPVQALNEYAATHPELTFGIMFNQRNNPLYVDGRGPAEGDLGEFATVAGIGPVAAEGEVPVELGSMQLDVGGGLEVAGEAVGPNQCLVVGDTPQDAEGAHAAGIACVGVASHNFNAEQLRAGGADYVIASLKDGLPL